MTIAKPQAVPTDASRPAEVVARELEQVLEQIGEAVIVKDLNAVVTYWNREAASLYGYSPQEAVGQSLRKLHAADLSEAEYQKLLERVRSGTSSASVANRRKKSGDTVRVSLKTSPLLDDQGKLVGEITVARDVTALYRTEESLRAAQANLQQRLTAIRDANRKLNQEISARNKAVRAMQRNNQTLATTVRQLEAFHHDSEVLSRMAELLQACTERTEAYAIVRETGAQLFPNSSGSLYIYRESRDALTQVSAWGEGQASPATLAPDECWALRLGTPHFVTRGATVRCRHAPEGVMSYVCMPLQGQGQALGLFHIAVEVDPKARRPDRVVERRLRAIADRVGPALANLKLHDALREMALRDGVTGLYNRRYLEDAMNRELHRAARHRTPVSVLMIDIDHFKRFNDKFGHDAGDLVLSAVARTITENTRGSDIACRYGGEELAIVLADADLQNAHERAEHIRRAIRDITLNRRGQTLPSPSASIGIAAYPEDGTSPADLLKAADQALYRAKREGRDRVCLARDMSLGEPLIETPAIS
jgi:diguanylate cyclase (GGDEF)-like protein/PAS domain S-box-containing protein